MKGRITSICAAIAVASASIAAGEIRVRQDTTEFTIEPKVGQETVEQFYDYDNGWYASSDTGYEVEGRSLLMIYESLATQSLSLVTIHDEPNEDEEPGTGRVYFVYEGLPSSAVLSVYDEPDDPLLDEYDPDPPLGGRTTAQWQWQDCCTDGLAIDELGDDFCIRVTPDFQLGISAWDVGSGDDVIRTELPSKDEMVVICKDCHADFTCPTQVIAECQDGSGGADLSVVASGTSVCRGEVFTNDYNSGGADASGWYPVGTTQVEFTLSDRFGFESRCQTIVVVQDVEEPVIDACPEPLELACDGPSMPTSDPAIQAWVDGFLASDACGPVEQSNDLPPTLGSQCEPGTPRTVTFTARDLGGHDVSCTSSILLVDKDPPVVDHCPAPLTLECDDPMGISASDPRLEPYFGSFSASDACSVVAVGHQAPQVFPSGCGPGLKTEVIFSAADSCGHQTTCLSSITVQDTTPPAATCPGPLDLECSAFGGVPASDQLVGSWRSSFTAEDVCGNVSLTDDVPPLLPAGCGLGTSTDVTFSATDDCGLETTCVEAVTVHDTLPPVITGCPAPVTLECNELGGISATDQRIRDFLGSVAATDICSDVTVSNDAPGFFPSACEPGAETAIQFEALDGCLNADQCQSRVFVRDTTAPEITSVPPPLTLECTGPGGLPATDPEVVAWLEQFQSAELCGPGVDEQLTIPPVFAYGCEPGQATAVQYTTTDSCGNQAAAQAELTVVDTTPPMVDAQLTPVIPLPPSPPSSVCNPPTSRLFRVDCGVADTCDPAAAPDARLYVTHHEVPIRGVCEKFVQEIPVPCGSVVEIAIEWAPCPDKETSTRGLWDPTDHASALDFPFPLIKGEEVVLVVSGEDSCGNNATVLFDPRLEPSPLCDQVTLDGTCCPAVQEPEKFKKCKKGSVHCGRCDAQIDPPPLVTGVSGIGVGCKKKEAEQAALDAVGRDHCVGPFDPDCGGLCRLTDCFQTTAEIKDEARIACRKITLPGCKDQKGHECTAVGNFECGCDCY